MLCDCWTNTFKKNEASYIRLETLQSHTKLYGVIN